MGLSSVMWGYVAAKGKLQVRDDPRSKYNATAISSITQFARFIEELPPEIKEKNFIGSRKIGAHFEGIILDLDLDSRFGLAHLLEKFGHNGTLVVASLGDLTRRGASCEAEYKFLEEVSKRAIAVIDLERRAIAKFLCDKNQVITDKDLSSISISALLSRNTLMQRFDGLKHAYPMRETESHWETRSEGFKYFAYRDGEVHQERISNLASATNPSQFSK